MAQGFQVIRVRLRDCIERRERDSGEHITYDWLAKRTGLSRATIEAVGSRPTYNPRLSTIEILCEALECTPAELIEYTPGRSRQPARGRR
jgi:putative transcriptional regulator